MRFANPVYLLLFLATLGSATIPRYDTEGYKIHLSEDFRGPPGGVLQGDDWEVTDANVNGRRGVQLSGGDTMQLVPWKNGEWDRARATTRYTMTPKAGKRTMLETRIRFGSNPIENKQGFLAGLWISSEQCRHGVNMVGCGSLAVIQTYNGILKSYSGAICTTDRKAACRGVNTAVDVPNQEWQIWRVVWDRTNSSWHEETITWYLNGRQFDQVRAGLIAKTEAHKVHWDKLAAGPLMLDFLLDINDPITGPPNEKTREGFGSMMEVDYAVWYVSA
ncbi:hypothetical protein VTI74DRAFT_9560 [Chaetomium olivicolor]